jgi:hypothetical protein
MLLSLSLILFVMHLGRRRVIKEQYCLLWLLFGVVMLVLSMNTGWLEHLASYARIVYAPSLLFLVGITLSFVLILHLTVVVSKLTERIVLLTQELGLMKHEHELYEKANTR